MGMRSDGWLGGQRRQKGRRRHRLERRSTVMSHGRGKVKMDERWGDPEGNLRGTQWYDVAARMLNVCSSPVLIWLPSLRVVIVYRYIELV